MRARVIVATLACMLAVLVVAPFARADTAYRYWTYWTVSDGNWVFSQVGPASTIPVDGDVQGWRFAVTTSASGIANIPRTDPTTAFARLCGAAPQPKGQVRVAMIIDTGLSAAAPDGQSPPPPRGACAVIDEGASGAAALMAIATPRVKDGLVCGIDEYPVGECAIAVEVNATEPVTGSSVTDVLTVPVADATDATDATDAAMAAVPVPVPVPEKGSPAPLIAVGLVIALGLTGAWALQRRRVP